MSNGISYLECDKYCKVIIVCVCWGRGGGGGGECMTSGILTELAFISINFSLAPKTLHAYPLANRHISLFKQSRKRNSVHNKNTHNVAGPIHICILMYIPIHNKTYSVYCTLIIHTVGGLSEYLCNQVK